MHVTDLLHGYAALAAANPVLLLATLLAVGAAFGAVKIKGISLGPAAILFAALALSAANSELSSSPRSARSGWPCSRTPSGSPPDPRSSPPCAREAAPSLSSS